MSEPTGYRAALESAALFETSAHGTLRAVGDDAAVFLHNLSTNDIKKLPAWEGCEAFFCTATAKVLGQAWIWREPPRGKKGKEERLWLDLPPGQLPRLLAHLDRHIVGEDVALQQENPPRFHLAGPKAGEILGAAAQPLAFAHPSEGLMIRRRDLLGVPGFDVLGPLADELRRRLSAVEGSPEAFHALRVEAGLPWWGHDITEETFAPETGRIPAAISYAKGCYLGQEPIVMARDRGMVQRAFVGLETGETLAPVGASLKREGKDVGRVTSAAWSPRRGQAVALGYVKRLHSAAGTELAFDGGTARVAALPLASGTA
ncbi:MAG: hypothetical protein K2W96_17720 [Gemmataceae bacterium]|nr:hypothetical protein [Gemmataceae bacterium]